MVERPGADSEEKHEPVSDIDTAVVDSLKALDLERPIREADIANSERIVWVGPEADITHLNLRRFLGSLPKPEHDERDERTDKGGYDIPCDGEKEAGSERYRYLVEGRNQPEHVEQQAADERTGKADGQIADQSEALAIQCRHQPGEASTDQADDDPGNQLID
jgi:hypothetical protein